jgi:hypothetical protein
MEFTPGQQRMLFVVIVLALIGLGIFLVTSHRSNSGAPAAQGTTAPAATSTAPAAPPATIPATTPVSTAGGAEIYQWLPFTPADLSTAAQTTLSFAKNYATWSYKESKAAYTASLSGLVTAPEQTALEAGYSTQGVSDQRISTKQVSTGSGVIDAIRSFGNGSIPGSGGQVSITFVVTINQQVASTQPTQTTNNQYAVTVVQAGSAWQVNDIELSQLGNQ